MGRAPEKQVRGDSDWTRRLGLLVYEALRY
jgi:hypothetical protein